MPLFIIRTAFLLLYIVLAAQGLFYLFAVKEAFSAISIESFAEQRKAVDLVIGNRLKIAYLLSLILLVAILVLSGRQPKSPTFITTLIAGICLLADLVLAIKFNIPLNQKLAAFSLTDRDTNWEIVRTDWLYFIAVRGWIMIAGLLVLLGGLIYPNKVS